MIYQMLSGVPRPSYRWQDSICVNWWTWLEENLHTWTFDCQNLKSNFTNSWNYILIPHCHYFVILFLISSYRCINFPMYRGWLQVQDMLLVSTFLWVLHIKHTSLVVPSLANHQMSRNTLQLVPVSSTSLFEWL